MGKFIDNLCKTRGTPRNRNNGGFSMVTDFDTPWAYNALKKAGLTDGEIKCIIEFEKVSKNQLTLIH